MGWFNKQQTKEFSDMPDLPELPELPSLPELPNMQKKDISHLPEPPRAPNKLPSFPNNTLGEKFSQNIIKEAVSGKKEVKGFETEDFDEDEEMPMMQKPRKILTREIDEDDEEIHTIPSRFQTHEKIPMQFREAAKMVKKNEPIFIRLDKFEESLKIFEKTKEQINDMESLLKDIKKIKDEEEKELEFWEKEMLTIKDRIAKVDKDLFSMLE